MKFFAALIITLMANWCYANTSDEKVSQKNETVISSVELVALKEDIGSCLAGKGHKCIDKFFDKPFRFDWKGTAEEYLNSKECKPSELKVARTSKEIMACFKLEGVLMLVSDCIKSHGELVRELPRKSDEFSIYGEIAICQFRKSKEGWKMYEFYARP